MTRRYFLTRGSLFVVGIYVTLPRNAFSVSLGVSVAEGMRSHIALVHSRAIVTARKMFFKKLLNLRERQEHSITSQTAAFKLDGVFNA